jgi:hypothetical protein
VGRTRPGVGAGAGAGAGAGRSVGAGAGAGRSVGAVPDLGPGVGASVLGRRVRRPLTCHSIQLTTNGRRNTAQECLLKEFVFECRSRRWWIWREGNKLPSAASMPCAVWRNKNFFSTRRAQKGERRSCKPNARNGYSLLTLQTPILAERTGLLHLLRLIKMTTLIMSSMRVGLRQNEAARAALAAVHQENAREGALIVPMMLTTRMQPLRP